MAWDGHPEMLIFDKFLLECLIHPHMHPGSDLKFRNHRAASDHDGCVEPAKCCFSGSIYNDGEHIYRIGQYTNESGCDSWHARWPD